MNTEPHTKHHFEEILSQIVSTGELHHSIETLPSSEQRLLQTVYASLSIIDNQEQLTNQSNVYIGFFGPLGVGKTTLATALTEQLGAQFIVKEPYLVNPFWKHSQTDPIYMLRSQIYFLMSNIESDHHACSFPGIAISDTSTITDIVMWAQWYYEIGHLTEQEFALYTELVTRLKPRIPRPSLLVTLLPTNVDNLYEGIRQRESAEVSRKGELVFSKEDLQAQITRVEQSVHKIKTEWNTHVLNLTIDPTTIYTDAIEQQHYIDQIVKTVFP